MLAEMMLESAAAMGIAMTRAQAEQFEQYHAMLTEANRQFNLTRVPDELREAADRNYLDCIAPLAHGWPEGVRSLVDVGSGAGFPGIPLSIMLPEVHVVMVDSLDKRVKFLQSVIDALGLNAEAVHARAEDAARRPELRERFDMAVARAVAPMCVLCEYLLPFVRVGGRMLALKGPMAAEEAERAQTALAQLNGRLARVCPVSVPGRDWDHRVIEILKTGATPDRFPRRAGIAETRPLK